MSALLMGGDFSPADFASVVGWFDPTSDDYVTKSGSNLLSMTDRIQGTVMTTTGTIPLGADANMGGARTMLFDSESYLSSASVPSNYPKNSGDELTFISVFRVTGWNGASSAPCVFSMGASTDWGAGIVGSEPYAPPYAGQVQAVGGGSYRAYGSSFSSPNLINIAAIHAWRATASGHEVAVNGTGIGLVSTAYLGVGAGPLYIGRRWTGDRIAGTVGEIIIGKSVSTEERLMLEGYLAWRYGLAGALPSAHPYKNNPP